jgi:hypothetical protein
VSISYPPVASQVVASVNAGTIPVTTTSSEIIPANSNRAKGSLIVNNSKAALVIRLSASTAPAGVGGATSISIPASGGNYLLPPEYQGAIQGLLASNATSSVQFIEPSY